MKQKELHKKEYNSWRGMRERCLNKNHRQFKDYGGRGIKVCERWDDFSNFFSDMGEKPSNLYSIDRIDNDKGYFPENCKWSTKEEQARNMSNNISCLLEDEDGYRVYICKGLLREFSKRNGLDYSHIYKVVRGERPSHKGFTFIKLL